ncbi:ankyrin repeat domain-containing protein [Spiroplasma endosymbiont of Eupeodes luniger]|uniref:ankyrin repeat domain-containing protein n=1 Tax=Spiroplasma endosymbiont of Eupeodes luniger TaxID=3066300 RepID=UPI003BB13ECC
MDIRIIDRIFLNYNVNKNTEEAFTCLTTLLDLGADINTIDINSGNTLLHFIIKNNLELLFLLILKRANIKNNDGETPLHMAIMLNCVREVNYYWQVALILKVKLLLVRHL